MNHELMLPTRRLIWSTVHRLLGMYCRSAMCMYWRSGHLSVCQSVCMYLCMYVLSVCLSDCSLLSGPGLHGPAMSCQIPPGPVRPGPVLSWHVLPCHALSWLVGCMYGCMYACQTACLDVYMCVGWSVGMCVYMCVYDVRSLWMQSDLYVGVGDIPFRKRPTEINRFWLRHAISQAT